MLGTVIFWRQDASGIIFETPRLRVRLATPADAVLIQNLWNDPRVLGYVGFPQGLGISLEQAAAEITSRADSPFVQLLVIELSDSRQLIGQCKMDAPTAEGVATTDVKLLPEFWGAWRGGQGGRSIFIQSPIAWRWRPPNVANIASNRIQAVGGVRAWLPMNFGQRLTCQVLYL
jgi:hypothetical protein